MYSLIRLWWCSLELVTTNNFLRQSRNPMMNFFNNGMKDPELPSLVIFPHASEHFYINFYRSCTVLHCGEPCPERDSSSTTEESKMHCNYHIVGFNNDQIKHFFNYFLVMSELQYRISYCCWNIDNMLCVTEETVPALLILFKAKQTSWGNIETTVCLDE